MFPTFISPPLPSRSTSLSLLPVNVTKKGVEWGRGKGIGWAEANGKL
jgi:hypothetical protein